MDLFESVKILSTLPKLNALHLEDDGISNLPANFSSLVNIKNLDLNNNKFSDVPMEIKGMKNLKYLDLQDNAIPKFKTRLQNLWC